MSIFDNNIQKDLPVVTKGRKWMKHIIKECVQGYVESETQRIIYGMPISVHNECEEMSLLWDLITDQWINMHRNLKSMYGIYGTETVIEKCNDNVHRYEVIVNVKFTDNIDDDYVELVRVPIMNELQRSLRSVESDLMKDAVKKAANYKPKII